MKQGQDIDALVRGLAAGSPQEALAHGLRTWLQWRAPGSNSSSSARRTLLMVAAFQGDLAAVQASLEHGADPNAQSPDDGATGMHLACHACAVGTQENLSEMLELLLRHGGNKELRDSLGRRPVDILMAQASWHALTGCKALRDFCVPLAHPGLLRFAGEGERAEPSRV